MRASARSLAVLAVLGATLAVVPSASAGSNVKVVVLKEHGIGTPTSAQPYLDQFIANAAVPNGWAAPPASTGKYFTNRGQAEAWIKSENPQFGIFSLPAFLSMRKAYNLEPVGEAKTDSGGEQYFIVSTKLSSLGDCKGKKLASDHGGTPDDVKFIESVVAAGAFKVSDFTLVPTTRFAQAGNTLVNGDADCALIHDAQLATLKKGGTAVNTVWSSATLPGMIVVAFPSAPAALKSTFQGSLPSICTGAGADTCKAVGVLSLNGNASATAGVISKYP